MYYLKENKGFSFREFILFLLAFIGFVTLAIMGSFAYTDHIISQVNKSVDVKRLEKRIDRLEKMTDVVGDFMRAQSLLNERR